ncbi:hypothetical protein CKO28_12720 [Rhodovibrio sodomensis]|uniref:Uncharacterized protein n=1 Tax=Rhodovibrio sodomensis TaxID=1088 RepID=A0ABS1DF84_9PROT|nr:hypothetical protein [Rhodovibrio sodomensis]
MQSGQGRRAPIAVVHRSREAHLYACPVGSAQAVPAGHRNRIAGSPRAMTPFNMIGVSYVVAIALLTLGAMAV